MRSGRARISVDSPCESRALGTFSRPRHRESFMPGVLAPLSKLSPGSVAHNKGRIENHLARQDASKPQGRLGAAPTWMMPEEKKIWKQLVKTATAQLGANDRTLMAIAVTLKSKLEAHTIAPSELSQLISCLGKLGFIPVDRPAVWAAIITRR